MTKQRNVDRHTVRFLLCVVSFLASWFIQFSPSWSPHWFGECLPGSWRYLSSNRGEWKSEKYYCLIVRGFANRVILLHFLVFVVLPKGLGHRSKPQCCSRSTGRCSEATILQSLCLLHSSTNLMSPVTDCLCWQLFLWCWSVGLIVLHFSSFRVKLAFEKVSMMMLSSGWWYEKLGAFFRARVTLLF